MTQSAANNKAFKPIPLVLHEPKWGSNLASIIVELEQLRVRQLGGSVHPKIFFQLKNIFQMLESLGSARIEGNRTTLAELVDKTIENKGKLQDGDAQMREFANIERAIKFIEEHVDSGTEITRALISEVHKLVVKDLPLPPGGEGSRTPGVYRSMQVGIQQADHVPPEPTQVPDYMEEMLAFVNAPTESQNDLLVTALAHHRAAWIHPFDNGNGRVIRLFTYALLIRQGFAVKTGRILNPAAIFYSNRQKYYDMLALADTGEAENVLAWCEYMLAGLRDEIKKIDNLLDKQYMTFEILMPALDFALNRKHITDREHAILMAVVTSEHMEIKTGDIAHLIGNVSPEQRSRVVADLREKGMLIPVKEGGRIYTIGFMNNYLLKGVMKVLEDKGFVPASLNQKQ
jgi:Fic family protein